MIKDVQPKKAESLFERWLRQALGWVETHREQFWAALGLILLIAVFIFFAIRRHAMENEEAWNRLGTAQGHLALGKPEAARQELQEWEKRFGRSSAATYARFLKADLLSKSSDYASAAQLYDDLAQSARPADLRPLALSAQSSSEEMAGHLPQALALAQEFTNRYPDHFLAAPMYLAQARLDEMAGNPAAASAVYDRFANLYPQSPWTPLARARLQTLSGSKTPVK